MSVTYQYNYARIDENGFCYDVSTCTYECSEEEGYIAIPEYSTDYLMKYYLNGAWYMDAAGTIPWTPAE